MTSIGIFYKRRYHADVVFNEIIKYFSEKDEILKASSSRLEIYLKNRDRIALLPISNKSRGNRFETSIIIYDYDSLSIDDRLFVSHMTLYHVHELYFYENDFSSSLIRLIENTLNKAH